MRVILTRHYQTIANTENRILGWSNSPPCPGWKNDIDFIASRLRECGISLDAIYSSDLERARETAKAYTTLFGIADVAVIPELNEINYGKLQTREKSWVSEQYPQHKKDPGFVYPDGESFCQMRQRSMEFMSSLTLANSELTLLVVSHAGVIRGMISHFLGLEYASSLKQGVPFRYIGDFLFEGKKCVRYDELGKSSGFVEKNTIEVPFNVN